LGDSGEWKQMKKKKKKKINATEMCKKQSILDGYWEIWKNGNR
jgi:hypothetical protein